MTQESHILYGICDSYLNSFNLGVFFAKIMSNYSRFLEFWQRGLNHQFHRGFSSLIGARETCGAADFFDPQVDRLLCGFR